MNNIKMTIMYDGTRYNGWESHSDGDTTIQGKIQAVLSIMTGEPVKVISAGRTDAGVHARGMVANAHIETSMKPEEIRDYMNKYLPEDICIMEVKFASDRFHSRYNAIGKTYRYTCYVSSLKPVFDRKYVYCLDKQPDIEAMKKAADYLLGEHDFTSFCGNSKMKKSAIRRLYSIDIKQDGAYINMIFHGAGFLQYMVRILTGTLLEVGYHLRTPESMTELLQSKNRALAGATAPSLGLCLMSVDYNKDNQ